ncbi:hypothetical protein [Streptomyces sp. NPDC046832]|uniref:hypothetical protein n=1 Tax=Streptomyces sp. NPDC046832 TaxID=3155020 RepID=UPI00340B98D3
MPGSAPAVHGVGGSAANAFRHRAKPVEGRGEWRPSWRAVTGDGRNFIIGSAKRYAAHAGLRHERRHRRDLQHRPPAATTGADGDAASPAPDFTFGGTLDNDIWLEAVMLTV